jgi:hypothetical protein
MMIIIIIRHAYIHQPAERETQESERERNGETEGNENEKFHVSR